MMLGRTHKADRRSAITPQSPEIDANVTPIDGLPMRNGLPVLDEAQSNTDHGVTGTEPRPAVVNKYLTLPIAPSAIAGLVERGFLAAGKEDDEDAILNGCSAMLNAAWRAGVRAETAEPASADA
jgi:hypothetical protein